MMSLTPDHAPRGPAAWRSAIGDLPLCVRAWLPVSQMEKDTFGQPWRTPTLHASLWFVGHTDPHDLEDTALDAMVAQAHAAGVVGADAFACFLEQEGYLCCHTGGDGTIYAADITDEDETASPG